MKTFISFLAFLFHKQKGCKITSSDNSATIHQIRNPYRNIRFYSGKENRIERLNLRELKKLRGLDYSRNKRNF